MSPIQGFVSSLAQLSPSTIVAGWTVFVALKSYFDGSRTRGRSMTLASVSGDEQVWVAIEPEWDEALKEAGAPYMHMKEAMSLEGPFKNWAVARRDTLVERLMQILVLHGRNPRLRMFSCSIDLAAHRQWATVRRHPKPERLCVRIVFPLIYEWYATFPEKFLDVMELYFDRDERFMAHIADDWRTKKFRRMYPAWELVRTIAPANMSLTIPLQIADMYAWSRNRINTNNTEDEFVALARLITAQCLNGIHKEVGAKAMAEMPPRLLSAWVWSGA